MTISNCVRYLNLAQACPCLLLSTNVNAIASRCLAWNTHANTCKHSIQVVGSCSREKGFNNKSWVPWSTCFLAKHVSLASLTILDIYRLKHLHISSLIYAYAFQMISELLLAEPGCCTAALLRLMVSDGRLSWPTNTHTEVGLGFLSCNNMQQTQTRVNLWLMQSSQGFDTREFKAKLSKSTSLPSAWPRFRFLKCSSKSSNVTRPWLASFNNE